MNLAYKDLLPENFAPDSRVWIYQSNRLMGMGEVLEADRILQQFVQEWNTHGAPVKGFATIFFGQFIVIIADESRDAVSGCSTDSSVRVIKALESAFNISLFDRQLLAFVVKEKVQLIPMAQLKHALQHGMLKEDDLYFNNMVSTLAELRNNWIIPINQSWLQSRLGLGSLS
ncbi:hypothetical protein [Flavihumibacter petaseus]|uniref:ABC transporter ATPase n=1 Tax=Flavihumibacter petaseus NBRC 106054 TaxID=1220578 RepID=A0A0E9N3K1_9BACT|nr:hypothetical protein [Flavihumibacter petaseus]GAO44389.1 hypothetical protein FPE01S_03_04270 [Flavihumibacter petaseus NBRC 106054]